MLNMDHTTLTPRRIEALVAAYIDGHPWNIPEGTSPADATTARLPSRAGGATERMCDELRWAGYLTTRNNRYPVDEPASYELTVKGYDALKRVDGRLAKLIDPTVLEKRREDREAFEAERDARVADREGRDRAAAEERAERTRRSRVAKARKALKDYGFEAHRLNDERLLDLVDRMGSI